MAIQPVAAQTPASGNGMVNAFDSSLAKLPICGATASYFQSLAVDNSQGNTAFRGGAATGPSSFPANAKVRCGKFELYYEDLLPGNPAAGFGDPALGMARRNTFCAVLTYIQSIVSFANIPTNAPIRILVQKSYSSQYPAPQGTLSLSKAGPFYSSNAVSPVHGFVRDYTISGIDPSPRSFHGSLLMNFDQYWQITHPINPPIASSIFWHSNHTTPISKCAFDLYSTLLHECTHLLGWFSLIDFTAPNGSGTVGPFSGLDNSIHISDMQAAMPNGYRSWNLTKLINNNVIISSPVGAANYWLTDANPPENLPVLSSCEVCRWATWLPNFMDSYISHLDDQVGVWGFRTRISPGNKQPFVMGSRNYLGVERRMYTKQEIRAFSKLFGYGYVNNNATPLQNRVPYSTKMLSQAIGKYYYADMTQSWLSPDGISPDYTISNNTGSSLVINVNTDPANIDPDGDVMSVMPGSLINYRGCGNGGNNHDQLVVSQNGGVITYTPRSNFVGIAQFGFSLWDGKEKGMFVLYTIKVNPGNNISIPTNGNLVINGDFEEGTEVKRFGTDEGIENAAVTDNEQEGKLFACHFADAHPLDFWTNAAPISFDRGGGIVVKDAARTCSNTFNPLSTYSYGSFTNSCGVSTSSVPVNVNIWGNGSLAPTEAINGERYQALRYPFSYSRLLEPILPCQDYILEFDAYDGYAPFYKIGFIKETTTNLSNVRFNDINAITMIDSILNFSPVITGSGNWKHFSVPISYCGSGAADVIALFAPWDAYHQNNRTACIDNISLKRTSPSLCGYIDGSIVLRGSLTAHHGNFLPATASALLSYFGNPPSNTISTNIPIIIDGNFKIDHDIIFNGGDLRFANPANATAFSGITVEQGKTLTIRDAQLKAACGYLWNGIIVPGNAGSINISGSTISDMKDGIVVSGDVPASFTINQFKNNYFNLKFYDNSLSHNLTVDRNTFFTTVTLLLPPYTNKKSKAGVYAHNCRKLLVGPNVASNSASNFFDNLSTGIYIDADAAFPIWTGIDYKLFNNNFKNITGGKYGNPMRDSVNPNAVFTDLFSDPDGTAIFVRNNMRSVNMSCRMQIGYLGTNTAKIQNCSKAVTVYNLSVDANKVKIQDGVWGFSLGKPESSNYNLSENQITNTHRGVGISGTASNAKILKNAYSSPTMGNPLFNGYSLGQPVGISLSNASPLNANPALLEENNLTINSLGGTAIVLQNTGKGVVVNKNTINLLTSQQGNSSTSNPVLAGVSLNNCNNSILQNNQVNGNAYNNPAYNPAVVTPRTNIAGFYLNRSPGLVIKTNQVANLKYGFLVTDNNTTAKDAVTGNCFLNHWNGILFRQVAGNRGTLGDIGAPMTDNNNRFNGTFYSVQNNQKMKVFSLIGGCSTGMPSIYTRTNPPNSSGTINANESGSNIPSCKYNITNNNINSLILPACSLQPVVTWPTNSQSALQLYDTTGAIAVAQDSVTYPCFPHVAKWIADKNLYEILSQEPDARAAKPALSLFYDQKETTVFKNIRETDSILAGMSDSAVWNDKTIWEQWLADAKVENNNIVSPDMQEENEHLINDAYMRYLEGGFDTLNNTTDSTLIASLALSCPYVNGTAVYKARMLYSYWVPAETYTDLEICNAVGLYKGGRNPLDEENELLNSFQIPQEDGEINFMKMERRGIAVSPNPGTGLFKVTLTGGNPMEGTLEVSNLMGQEVATISLKGNTAELSLKGQPAGLYFYRWVLNGKVAQSGKIVLNP